MVVGVDDADMALCAARAQELGGGLVVARDGAVRGELALPIAGLLSDAPVEEVADGLEDLQDLLREQGVEIGAPFMTLSFLALSVIPSLKITDRGLVDVDAFALVPLELSRATGGVRRAVRRAVRALAVGGRARLAAGAGGDEDVDDALRGGDVRRVGGAQQLALIRAHPDLGEKVGVLTEHSASEQAGLGLDRLAPAEYERFMATNTAYREKFGIPFVVCVREHDRRSRSSPTPTRRLGNTRERRSRPRSARSRRSPACDWRTRCEPARPTCWTRCAAGPRRASRSSCARDGAVLATVDHRRRRARARFGDVGGRRVRAGLRGRRLLRRRASSSTGSRSGFGSPTRRRNTTCRCSSRPGPTAPIEGPEQAFCPFGQAKPRTRLRIRS